MTVIVWYRCARCRAVHYWNRPAFTCCVFDDMDGNIAAAESFQPPTIEQELAPSEVALTRRIRRELQVDIQSEMPEWDGS